MELLLIANGIISLLLARYIRSEHKKTRKETQEIKTRLTQVRKDLNKIEKNTENIYCDCDC